MNKEDEERALRLHKESIIINGLEYAPAGGNAEYFNKLIAAGVTTGNVCVVANEPLTPLQAIKGLKAWYDSFEKHSDTVMPVLTVRDIEKAKKEGKFGVIMGAQNPDMLGADLTLLPIYKRLGLKIIQLSYYGQSLLGEGCGERTDSGLSNFGIEVVKEMNRLRLAIDLAHCGDQVTMDGIKYSKSPVLITHSNARGIVNHKRNKTDEQIKALASKGGVIGVIAWSPLCEVRKGVRPTVEDLLDIVDYIVKLVGPDYVGLGLDLAPFSTLEHHNKWAQLYPDLRPKGGFFERNVFTNKDGVDDVSRLPEITKGLIARGYSDQDVEKILGLNFLRAFKEVWGG